MFAVANGVAPDRLSSSKTCDPYTEGSGIARCETASLFSGTPPIYYSTTLEAATGLSIGESTGILSGTPTADVYATQTLSFFVYAWDKPVPADVNDLAGRSLGVLTTWVFTQSGGTNPTMPPQVGPTFPNPTPTPAPPTNSGPVSLNGYSVPLQCTYHCGGIAPSGCWCDSQCAGNGDCCAGYTTTCWKDQWEYDDRSHNPVPPIAQGLPAPGTNMQILVSSTSTTMCAGFCGQTSWDSVRNKVCYCDGMCDITGDCCADKDAYCSGQSFVPGPLQNMLQNNLANAASKPGQANYGGADLTFMSWNSNGGNDWSFGTSAGQQPSSSSSTMSGNTWTTSGSSSSSTMSGNTWYEAPTVRQPEYTTATNYDYMYSYNYGSNTNGNTNTNGAAYNSGMNFAQPAPAVYNSGMNYATNSGASTQSNSNQASTYGGGGGNPSFPPMPSHYGMHYGSNIPVAGLTGHANLDLHHNTYFDTLASYNTQAYQPNTMREGGFDSEGAAAEILYLRQALG